MFKCAEGDPSFKFTEGVKSPRVSVSVFKAAALLRVLISEGALWFV